MLNFDIDNSLVPLPPWPFRALPFCYKKLPCLAHYVDYEGKQRWQVWIFRLGLAWLTGEPT
ncbi:hypothetical protein D3C85_1614100 [compost metagenome]